MPEHYKCQACGESMGMPRLWGSTIEVHNPAVCEDCYAKGIRVTSPCSQCEELRARLESAERERDALRDALRTLVGHCDLGHTHAIDGRRQAYLKALDDARAALEKMNG